MPAWDEVSTEDSPAAGPQTSRRSVRLPQAAFVELLHRATETGAVNLGLGVPPASPPHELVEGAVAALRGGRHQYAVPFGLPGLRAAIADDLEQGTGATLDPLAEVTITCGATEALAMALFAVTDVADEVLIPEPFYGAQGGAVAMCGAVARYVPMASHPWRLDVPALAARITHRTRAVLLTSPHNPTGHVCSREDLDQVAALCVRRGLVGILDETYRHFVFDGCRHVSAVELPDWRRHFIVVGSLSKSLQISGWRLGYCVAAPWLTECLRKAHGRWTLGAPEPLQHGVVAGLARLGGLRPAAQAAWLGHQPEDRAHQVAEGLATMGLDAHRPNGGWFVLAGTAPLGWPADELAVRLVDEAGVFVAPGTTFFADPQQGRRWIRVGLLADEDTTGEALRRIAGFLAAQERPTFAPGPRARPTVREIERTP